MDGVSRSRSRWPGSPGWPTCRWTGTACWAGTYENSPDHHGILGADPAAPTWVNACGFSGHGLMQAPEIGRLVAEQVDPGAITSLDIERPAAGPVRAPRPAGDRQLGLVF